MVGSHDPERYTYCIVFLPGKLTRSLEVDAEICIVSLIILAHVFDGVDMERHGESVYGQHNSLSFAVY